MCWQFLRIHTLFTYPIISNCKNFDNLLVKQEVMDLFKQNKFKKIIPRKTYLFNEDIPCRLIFNLDSNLLISSLNDLHSKNNKPNKGFLNLIVIKYFLASKDVA